MKNQYWNFLTQCHFEVLFIEAHKNRSLRLQRAMNIFIAVASSGGIAAWAIWEDLWILWVLILAAFQVLTVIRPQLPTDKRVETLGKLGAVLSIQYLSMEQHWLAISNGTLTDAEVHKMYYEFLPAWNNAKAELLKSDVLPEPKTLIDQLALENEEHFRTLPNSMSIPKRSMPEKAVDNDMKSMPKRVDDEKAISTKSGLPLQPSVPPMPTTGAGIPK
ncbi:MAG TPA: hypothetical protein DCR44_04760 [Acholeplasmatales bacterium]|nr:hypothetical protein [Acholeplasmatales bacterium]